MGLEVADPLGVTTALLVFAVGVVLLVQGQSCNKWAASTKASSSELKTFLLQSQGDTVAAQQLVELVEEESSSSTTVKVEAADAKDTCLAASSQGALAAKRRFFSGRTDKAHDWACGAEAAWAAAADLFLPRAMLMDLVMIWRGNAGGALRGLPMNLVAGLPAVDLGTQMPMPMRFLVGTCHL